VLSRIRAVLPAAGPGRILVLSGFGGAVGTGLFLAGSMLFFIRGVGLSPYQVALGLGVAGAVGLLASMPLGAVADRVGPRRTVVALHLWRAVAYSLYLTVHSFPAFLIVVCATTVADKAAPPVNQAMVGLLFDKRERVRTMGFLRSAQNVGLSIGAILASFALSANTRSAYDILALGNGVSYILMAYLVWRLRVPATVRVPESTSDADTALQHLDSAVAHHRRPGHWYFIALTLANGALALHDTVLFVGLPLWIAQHPYLPADIVGVLLTLNTVLTAAGQVWWTRLAGTAGRAIRGMVAAGLVLAAASLLIGLTGAVASAAIGVLLLVGGALLLTVGENLHAACAWEISFELTPPQRRARYLAAFAGGSSARDMLGPTLITVLLLGLGPLGWAGLAAGFASAGVAARQSALILRRRGLPRGPQPRSNPLGGPHGKRATRPAAGVNRASVFARRPASAHHRRRPRPATAGPGRVAGPAN
jgi:MFS family permease